MSSLLRTRMIEDLRIRNYSERTIEIYVRCVAEFAKHFGQSPDTLGPGEIREYQRYLVEDKHASWATFNQSVCALRFFYSTTLNKDWIILHIPFPRRDKRLPVVLSIDEVAKLLSCVRNLKSRTILQTIYAAGLRVSEALALTPGDIDSSRMVLRIRLAKGHQDRYVTLSPSLLQVLRDYYKAYQPKGDWLFPSRNSDQPTDSTTVQRACTRAGRQAGLTKRVTPHTLRHSFATNMLEQGVNLRRIQILLGHSSLNTTAAYLHIAVGAEQSRPEMVDLLELTNKTLTDE